MKGVIISAGLLLLAAAYYLSPTNGGYEHLVSIQTDVDTMIELTKSEGATEDELQCVLTHIDLALHEVKSAQNDTSYLSTAAKNIAFLQQRSVGCIWTPAL